MADIRSTEPNETGHRRGRFHVGWNTAMAGHEYEEALDDVTWQNMGWRLGNVFAGTDYPRTSDELVDSFYDLAVRQMEEAIDGPA